MATATAQSHATQNPAIDRAARALSALGQEFHRRGWSLATSSNYSVVISRNPLQLMVTASGKHKNRLTECDFVCVDSSGKPVDEGAPNSSAETLLHTAIARQRHAGAILHTHSVWATVLSDRFIARGGLEIRGFEMLKGLDGVSTHEHGEWLPIFENTQDIPGLAAKVSSLLADPAGPIQHGFLIRSHGLYTWGSDLEAARRHVEALEFLLECVGRQLMLESTAAAPKDHIFEDDLTAKKRN